ncbi:hypothetical protein DRN98_03990 [Methanosarcinales archaeon]|nr:MAG: hypothetical protein DRN98_03990 [Methanosarcinales archaeon]
MGGIFPNETTIYIAPVDVDAASVVSSDSIVGEITNWSLSGGEADIESIPVIGGFVDKENPRSQFEVSFDIIVQNTAASTFDRYDIFKYGTGLTSATEGDAKTIWLKFTSGVTEYTKALGFNNTKAITWEPEMAADDMLRGTMTFKFSPTTELGAANLLTSTIAGSTMPALTW